MESYSFEPRSSRPTIQIFFSFNSSTVRAILVTFAMGRCSLAPAEALVTVGVTPTALRSGITTPSAPQRRRSQNRPQVMWILNSIEQYQQRIFSPLFGKQILEFVVLLARGDGDYALVRIVPSHAVEFCTPQKAHRNAIPATFVDHTLQAQVVPLLGATPTHSKLLPRAFSASATALIP